jgi:hypothetical protein
MWRYIIRSLKSDISGTLISGVHCKENHESKKSGEFMSDTQELHARGCDILALLLRGRRSAVAALFATSAASAAALTARTLSVTARRTRFFERLLLIGRQNLVQPGPGFLLEIRDLLLLIGGEIELIDGESRNQVNPSALHSATATAASGTRSAAALIAISGRGATAARFGTAAAFGKCLKGEPCRCKNADR